MVVVVDEVVVLVMEVSSLSCWYFCNLCNIFGIKDKSAIKLIYCDNSTFVLACMINISSGCKVLSLKSAEVVDPNKAARLVLPALLVNTLIANKPMICCAASKLHNKPTQLITTPIVMARWIMVDIAIIDVEVDDDCNGRIGLEVEEEERNKRLDKRVPFPHVHNMEMVLMNIPMEEMTKLRLLLEIEMDLANNKMIELMTVKMTCDHQLIQDVRCNNLEMCRINVTNGVDSTVVAVVVPVVSP
jgi:hypothetical protein